ncbi:MAG: Gfo/Idh/MocA family oxidoreductase [Novosphingobium sp.]
MAKGPLRVGMVGANPGRGWGSGVHRRVVEFLPEYTLQAVCTTRRETAEAAAQEFGAPLAFDNSADLVAHPDVDLVSVCVKAPYHYDIVRGALAAGKHVYCEWPLALTMDQVHELERMAAASASKAMLGLHLQGSPVHRYAAGLIADGFIGEVYGVNLHVRIYGPMSAPMAVRSGGTTLLTIYGGHLLDAVDHYYGGVAEMDARSVMHLPPVDETGAAVDRDAPDHLLMHGTLGNGAPFSIDLAGASLAGMGSVWRIDGTQGSLILSSRDPALHAMETLTLSGGRVGEAIRPLPVPAAFDCAAIPPAPDRYPAYPGMDASREALAAIGNLYSDLAKAVAGDLPVQPGFSRAARIQQMLAAIDRVPTRSANNTAPQEGEYA